MGILNVLKKADLFSGLDEAQIRQVEKFCTQEVYKAGDTICRQGRKLDKLYIIEDGLVGIFLELGPTTRRQILTAGNLEAFGWSAIIPGRRNSATDIALEETRVLACEGQQLLDLCISNPKIGFEIQRGIVRAVLGRLDHAYTQLMGVTCQI
ncbi:MAG: cyclic nucleotide-binding domain-containing protein [Chloroflexota bacterium]